MTNSETSTLTIERGTEAKPTLAGLLGPDLVDRVLEQHDYLRALMKDLEEDVARFDGHAAGPGLQLSLRAKRFAMMLAAHMDEEQRWLSDAVLRHPSGLPVLEHMVADHHEQRALVGRFIERIDRLDLPWRIADLTQALVAAVSLDMEREERALQEPHPVAH